MAHVEFNVTLTGIAQSLEDKSFEVYDGDNIIINNYKGEVQDIIQSLKDDFNRFPGGIPKDPEKHGDFREFIGRINYIGKRDNKVIIQSHHFSETIQLDMFILDNIMPEMYDIIKLKAINDKIVLLELNGEVIEGISNELILIKDT